MKKSILLKSRRKPPRGLRWFRGMAGVALFLIATVAAVQSGCAVFGAQPAGDRLARVEASPQWSEGRFRDVMPRQEPQMWAALKGWVLGGSAHREPSTPLPVRVRTAADFTTAPEGGLRITWLGHSTLLIEIDGMRFLTDPVWGEHVTPFAWMGVHRFYAPPLPFEALPPLDGVLISHDHYDHLDYPTILRFVDTDVPFYVPLGVGAHLERWGIAPSRIHELDWWDEVAVGPVTLAATPARHFSGRSLTDREKTLWAGWALLGPEHRVFFSGDTAFFPGFKRIGERYGPFDVTLMESGAYNALWADVHLGPEQAVEAHKMLGGGLMIPIHWGLFDLAMHGWTEPVERVRVAARKHGVRVATPRPGASVMPGSHVTPAKWWPSVPWETATQAPVRSSGLMGTSMIE